MDSQGSACSVASVSGQEWLELVTTAPHGNRDSDTEQLQPQETVREYFDFPDTDEDDPGQSQKVVEDDDVEYQQVHDDEWLELRPEDVTETLVSVDLSISVNPLFVRSHSLNSELVRHRLSSLYYIIIARLTRARTVSSFINNCSWRF